MSVHCPCYDTGRIVHLELDELHCNTGNNFGKIEILTTTVMLGHLSNNILERSIKDEEKPSTLSQTFQSLTDLFKVSEAFSVWAWEEEGSLAQWSLKDEWLYEGRL